MTLPEPEERVFPIRLSILENSPFLQNTSGTEGSRRTETAGPSPSSSSSSSDDGQTIPHQPATSLDVDIVELEPEEPRCVAAVPQQLMVISQTIQTDAATVALPYNPGHGSSNIPITSAGTRITSERCELAILEDGSYGVVQGRRQFTRCQDELIHVPGAIQSFGMLVALKLNPNGIYIPRIVSENSAMISRYSPQEIFAFGDIHQVMPLYMRPQFNTILSDIKNDYDTMNKSHEPVVFESAFKDRDGRLLPAWCAAHYLGGDVDLYICEFELHDYNLHPMSQAQRPAPTAPVDTLGSDHMDLATVSSMYSKSQPVINSFRFSSESSTIPDASSVEVVAVTTRIQRQLSRATTVSELLDRIVGVVKELSQFSRVMIYQFDHQYNGEVVAELMDPNVTQDVYLGLRFPHTDIPPQARRLYMINKVRVLFDRSQQTARLIGKERSDMDVPLDLTQAYLRAMSPVHLKYLENMEVRSSMSMSLETDGKLWGLLVCHSYGPTATHIPFTAREMCHYVGVAASTCLEKLLNADKLQARQIIETFQGRRSPNECIAASSDDLLKLFEADCGFLVVEGEARTIGRLAAYEEAVTLLKYLFFRRSSKILFSSNITADFKDLHYPKGFKTISGILYIPLSGTTDDCVVFYRRSQIREVHWAGRPSLEGKIGKLEPRNSFKKWTQIVEGTSKSWTGEQSNMAAMAQLVYGSFIRVWREKETAIKETRLKRLLLHDTSHKLRTPLNHVINLLEEALEKSLDPGVKENLQEATTASKSLIYVIDDLLNLTGSGSGSVSQLNDPFDIAVCLEETIEPLERLAKEKGIQVVLKTGSTSNRILQGDPPNMQRAVSILVANAIEHTTTGGRVIVEWAETLKKSNGCRLHVSVTDSGQGLGVRELDDMFKEFEQVPDEDFDEIDQKSFRSKEQREEVLHVGVGLAFVARYVKQRNGTLRVRSVKGVGSKFTIEMPFSVASRAPSLAARRDASPLPVLPMPRRTIGPIPPPPAHAMTPSGSSGAGPIQGMGASPPIVAPTPTISPMETARTPASQSFTVLIADDNIINIQILNRRLTKMGHKVLISRDGQECYNLFAANQSITDFVLLDLNMPVVDGCASIKMIRERERTHPIPSRAVQSSGRVPVFAISGMLRRQDEEKYREVGFDGWMPKPIDMRRLGTYLTGAFDFATRKLGFYDIGNFNVGGWFPGDMIEPPKEVVASPPLPSWSARILQEAAAAALPLSPSPAINESMDGILLSAGGVAGITGDHSRVCGHAADGFFPPVKWDIPARQEFKHEVKAYFDIPPEVPVAEEQTSCKDDLTVLERVLAWFGLLR
ncbi:putative signal transduction histidine-protein kinase [Podospora fimiseda]|uniref:Signal transduction histidine-protein kinase n=1 Tax=Podospora fimiseda TaxID=252190 RepID=A0AAN7BGW3_9PEZI|nr:putative signal transduction histidine-protein kinase [Podospora fimiseda]